MINGAGYVCSGLAAVRSGQGYRHGSPGRAFVYDGRIAGVSLVSRKSLKEIRRGLYGAGNIRCPICLERFTEDAAGRTVTLEHVPPKALGGKPMCLTCKRCNAGAGHGVDQAAVLLTRPPKATVEIMGQKETIHLSADPTSRSLGTITSPRHRPEDFSEWLKTKPTMTLTVRTLKSEYAAVSWLKSAYLSVVSLLGPTAGYRYAESKSLEVVRQQILQPRSNLIRSFSFRCPDSALDTGITLARSPLLCWSVKMHDSLVVLPRGGDNSFYRSLEALRQRVGTGHLQVTGSPTWNLLRFGFLPTASFQLKDAATFSTKYKLDTLFGVAMRVATPDFAASGFCADHQGRHGTVLFTGADDPPPTAS